MIRHANWQEKTANLLFVISFNFPGKFAKTRRKNEAHFKPLKMR